MRQIDNYTDKEREVLALKGMTAPRTASERMTNEEIDSTYQRIDANKAQHSPLPWNVGSEIGASLSPGFHIESPGIGYPAHVFGNSKDEALANAALIVRAVNHADKLAEAGERLKNAVSDLLNEPRTLEIEHYAETALHEWQAAYEAAQ